MTAPRILYCLGAAKAGTGWFHRWLEAHPDVHARTIKEPHWFDGAPSARIRALRRERAALVSRHARDARLRDFDDLIQAFEGGADEDYLAYLTGGREGQPVVADVTPAYGLLPVETLRRMDGFGQARFLLILRDPVARLWSHVRMIAARRAGTVTGAGEILDRTLAGDEPEIAARSDYAGMLTRLTGAIPAARRLVVFFEDLIGGTALDRIAEFLGIGQLDAIPHRVHAGPALTITEDQKRRARAWLAPQYGAVADHMGGLPPSWIQSERMIG